MTRIFSTLAILSTLLLLAAFALGWTIGDPTVRDPATQNRVMYHMNVSLGALVAATLVHAIVLTYFMGTGRWIEETSQAYSLPEHWRTENRSLKYRTIPAMVGAFFLLLLAGVFGTAADPASPVGFQGWGGVPAGTIHFLVAATALAVNLLVNLVEYSAIARNSELIAEIVGEAKRIRSERGLPA